eukprot:TRINITY_DN17155_c0_g2_i1.p1 TRINITY_DN17155_c0_g2~~TRINITY_DN17155_c0_g2_i1.p1  ORF type:complete len:546 (-),score=53.73 TRINITY_DN17155_c0_g2_i1:47-1684(-)
MEFCLCFETIYFVVGSFLILLHGFLSLRRYAQAVGWVSAVKGLCSTLSQTMVRWTRLCVDLLQCNGLTALTPRDELLMRKLSMRQLEAMSNAITIISGVLSLSIASILIRVLLRMELHGHPVQNVCLLVGLSVSLCTSHMLVLTSGVLEIYYAIMMLGGSCFVCSGPVDMFIFAVSTSFVFQILLSIHFMNMRSVLFWNLVACAMNITYAMRNPTHPSPVTAILFLTALTTLVILATAGFRRWAISSARQEIHISSLKIENSASSSLLDLVCDVVVQLDGKLNITHDSHSFKAMLMKTGGRTTEGVPLTSFLPDGQERENFQAQLKAARQAAGGKVGTFRTTLLDSLRNRVSADIFFVAAEMDVDVTHYLVGVRECNEADVIRVCNEPVVMETETASISSKDNKTTRFGHKGTPSVCERAEFKEGIAASQSETSNNLQFPKLEPTSKDAQFRTMLTCISSWNVNVDPVSTCCSFHAYARTVKSLADAFRAAPCDASFPNLAREGMQCQRCGIIEAEATALVCGLCESTDVKTFQLKPDAASTIQL